MFDKLINFFKKRTSNNEDISLRFSKYLVDSIDNINTKLKKLESEKKARMEDISNFSREERRALLRKMDLDKSLSIEINNLQNELGRLKLVQNLINGDSIASNNEEYEHLIIRIWDFILSNKKRKKSIDIEAYKSLLLEQIKKGLDNNVSCKFLTFFDEQGNLIKGKIIAFNSYLNSFYLEYVYRFGETISEKTFISLLIDDKQLQEARETVKALKDEKIERDRIAKELAEEDLKSRQKEERTRLSKDYEQLPKFEHEKLEVEKYFDIRLRKLKDNVVSLISWEDLKPLLLEAPGMTKNEFAILEERYKFLYLLEVLDRVLSKDNYRKLLMSFKMDEEIQEEVREFVFSEKIESMSDEEIGLQIMEIVSGDKNNDISNFIVFSNPGLLDDSIEIVNNSSAENIEALNKNIIHQLYLLQVHTIDELRKGGTAMFHVIKNGYGEFVLPNSMKGYRFGRRKSKVCFFKPSVCSENIEMLKSYYNLNRASDVLIVFGLGNVGSEREDDLYDRCVKQAQIDYERIELMGEILAVPFTEETFNLFTSFIDESNKSIVEARKMYNDGNDILSL